LEAKKPLTIKTIEIGALEVMAAGVCDTDDCTLSGVSEVL
jgi:Zn-dependent alcohol dehydrogenase